MQIDLKEDRYARQTLITWWDQSALLRSRVLVVGAGALGNEIVKNLALVGVGHISIVDMDHIENSNLARCVFFREEDAGRPKAQVLAEAASRLNPDIKTEYFVLPVQKLGDAFLDDFDLVVAGLDNREARIWLGAAVRRLGKFWIDGAIEGLMGKAQTFTPTGPCYACSMTAKEWEIIAHRRSCALLSKEEMLTGHTPTNATTSSIIAGVQTQEAIKHLAGREDMSALKDKIWRFMGDQMDTFSSIVSVDEDCMYHFDPAVVSKEIDLPESLETIFHHFQVAEDGYISFYNDFLYIEPCAGCEGEPVIGFRDLMKGLGVCKSCGSDRNISTANRLLKSDDAAKVKISPELWPYKALIQVYGTTVETISVRGAKND
jgi:adenylyltransferase/sulfurtransferase